MKKMLITAALLAAAGSAFAVNPYLLDNSGKFAHSTYYSCVRTGQWTPAAAQGYFGCDKDINVNVVFGFDSTALDAAAQKTLTEVAAAAKAGNVEATGYADRLGSAAYNQKLALARAQSVKNFLVKSGVPADKVAVKSKGAADPVVTCADGANVKECLAPNRRVNVLVK